MTQETRGKQPVMQEEMWATVDGLKGGRGKGGDGTLLSVALLVFAMRLNQLRISA